MKSYKKIFVATKTRGFLDHLFNSKNISVDFYKNDQSYEVIKRNKIFIILRKLSKNRIVNYFGYFTRVKTKNSINRDIDFSYNKFLNTNKPYVIYLETPIALVNYSINNLKNKYALNRVYNYLRDSNLKGIVCLSKICYKTVTQLFDIPNNIFIKQIYPLIPNNNIDVIIEERIKLLYVSSDFYLKGGLEILELFRRKDIRGFDLTIVTIISDVVKADLNFLKSHNNIEIINFDLNYDELNELYKNNDIYINLTRMDSFGLVVLEALKNGNAFISNDLFSLKELIIENFNGFLSKPRYLYYDQEGIPNPLVWNKKKNTIYIKTHFEESVRFLDEKLTYYEKNRDKLIEHKLNSLQLAKNNDFSDIEIIKKWNELFINHF